MAILVSPVTIDVSWKHEDEYTLDLTAFLLNDSGRISDVSEMVFYGTMNAIDDCELNSRYGITLKMSKNSYKRVDSQRMVISLPCLPDNIQHVVFVVSNDKAKVLDKFRDAKVQLKSNDEYVSDLLIEDCGDNVFCMSVGAIQKKGNSWIWIDESACYAGGLESAYVDYVPKEIRDKNPIDEFKRPLFKKQEGDVNKGSKEPKLPPINPDGDRSSTKKPKKNSGQARGVMPARVKGNGVLVNSEGEINSVPKSLDTEIGSKTNEEKSSSKKYSDKKEDISEKNTTKSKEKIVNSGQKSNNRGIMPLGNIKSGSKVHPITKTNSSPNKVAESEIRKSNNRGVMPQKKTTKQ